MAHYKRHRPNPKQDTESYAFEKAQKRDYKNPQFHVAYNTHRPRRYLKVIDTEQTR